MTKYQLIKPIISAFIIALPLSFSASISADSLSVPVSEQGNPSIHVPKNGQKMDTIESQYGTPLQRVSAVGEPPISKWIYTDFTVYFENDVVLHSVLHRH